jgi:plasmid stabilization system protein ParE
MSDKKPAKPRKVPAEAVSPVKTGRPSKFTEEVAYAICARLADGESLRSICQDDDMPGRRTVLDWLDDDANASFRAKYARAREAQADLLAEEIVQIADTPQMGTKSVSKVSGIEISEGDMIEHRRLQVDARKWYAAKLAPKKYGDKITNELTGADGAPLTINVCFD